MLTFLGNLQLECAPAEVSPIKVLHRLLLHGLRFNGYEGKATGFPRKLVLSDKDLLSNPDADKMIPVDRDSCQN